MGGLAEVIRARDRAPPISGLTVAECVAAAITGSSSMLTGGFHAVVDSRYEKPKAGPPANR